MLRKICLFPTSDADLLSFAQVFTNLGSYFMTIQFRVLAIFV